MDICHLFYGEDFFDEFDEVLLHCTYVSALRLLKCSTKLWKRVQAVTHVKRIVVRLREVRNLEEINVYLQGKGTNKKAIDKALRKSVKHSKFYLVCDFINFGADPSYQNCFVLVRATTANRLDIVEVLLKDERVGKLGTNLVESFRIACRRGFLQIVERFLMEQKLISGVINDAFIEVCEIGIFEIVQVLLKDTRCDPRIREYKGIHVAVEKGHLPIVKLLMLDGRVDATFKQNVLIGSACQMDKVDVLRFLLSFSHLNPNDGDDVALYTCIQYDHPKCLKVMLQDKRVKARVEENEKLVDELFDISCRDGKPGALKELLEVKAFKPKINSLQLGIVYDKLDCVKLLLEDASGRIDPGHNRNSCLKLVCGDSENFQMLELFLNHPRVNPADRHNAAIKGAAEIGNKQFVKRLLRDPRVDPADKDCRAIRRANEKGKFGIVKLLLKDKRVKRALFQEFTKYKKLVKAYMMLASFKYSPLYLCSSYQINDIVSLKSDLVSPFDFLRLACIAQNYPAFKAICKKHADVDLSQFNNSLFCIACENVDSRFVNRLLKDKRVNPVVDKNWPLRIATWRGNNAVVRRLLKDANVDPSRTNNVCLWFTERRKIWSTCKILFDDKRVYSSLSPGSRKYIEAKLK